MIINFVTIFPEFVESFINFGLVNKAIKKNIIQFNILSLRDFSDDNQRRVDDKPYGGGPGMLLRYEPIKKAIDSVGKGAHNICLSPQGKKVKIQTINRLLNMSEITLICGRYEGIDQRLVDNHIDEEISIGDYVISGGELAAMVLLEALVRRIPGVPEDIDSILNESFEDGLLEHPHFSRPETIDDISVPKVLLNGNHEEIRRWRRKMSLGMTFMKRPDLLKNVKLTKEDDKLLKEYIEEHKNK
tara:strand:- start:15505 stop:16236 length:732 start_codon:yes stop_codon:yes gene_type:complete